MPSGGIEKVSAQMLTRSRGKDSATPILIVYAQMSQQRQHASAPHAPAVSAPFARDVGLIALRG